MQDDVTFKVKVDTGGYKVTRMAVEKHPSTPQPDAGQVGISKERLERFKRAFEAKWLKDKLRKEKNGDQ